MTDTRWFLGCALLAVAIAVAVALVPLGGMPHVTDEVAYTLQARLFAAGMRTGPAADNPSMLLYPFWNTSPASWSPFPPGWPALLAVGEVVGLAWLVNPLLFGAVPVLTGLLAREWAPPQGGEGGDVSAPVRLSALVAAISPGAWVLAASRMSHTSVLVALMLATLLVTRRRGGWWVGLAVAYVVLARPFDAFIIGGPLLLWGLRRVGWKEVVFPALATALVMWDNHSLTGSAWVFPVNAWYDGWVAELGREGCNRLGFGELRGCSQTLGGWGHTPAKAARIAGETFLRLDRLALGVPGASLLAIVGAGRLRRWEHAALVLLVVGGYALYWSPGMAYGARFWHPLYIVLPCLIATGLHEVARRWGALVAVVLVVAGGSTVVADLADRYWCVDPGLARILEYDGITEGVIFLDGTGRRPAAWPALGVDEFECDPMLESGDGLWLLDPTRTRGGLQVRHALPDAEQTRAYLDRHQPGAQAWLWWHDIQSDEFELVPVTR